MYTILGAIIVEQLDEAKQVDMARRRDVVVITTGIPFDRPGTTDLLRIETVQ